MLVCQKISMLIMQCICVCVSGVCNTGILCIYACFFVCVCVRVFVVCL